MTAIERRARRLFWIGVTIPAAACAVIAVIAGRDSWLGWATLIAEGPAAIAGVTVAWRTAQRGAS